MTVHTKKQKKVPPQPKRPLVLRTYHARMRRLAQQFSCTAAIMPRNVSWGTASKGRSFPGFLDLTVSNSEREQCASASHCPAIRCQGLGEHFTPRKLAAELFAPGRIDRGCNVQRNILHHGIYPNMHPPPGTACRHPGTAAAEGSAAQH